MLEEANDYPDFRLKTVTVSGIKVNMPYTDTVTGYTGEDLLIAVAKLLGIEVSLNAIFSDGKRMRQNARVIWNAIASELQLHYSQ